MANLKSIGRAIADEFGIREDRLLRSIEAWGEEAVLDILSQADGRFIELKKSQTITTEVDGISYDTNKDFNSPDALLVLDTDNNPIDKVGIVNLDEIVERRRLGQSVKNFCYFDNTPGGDDFVVVFATTPTEVTSYRLDYYRFPVANDAVLIRNENLIKKYIRSQLPPEVNKYASREFSTYLRLRDTYSDRAIPLARQRSLKPRWTTQELNDLMYGIGQEY